MKILNMIPLDKRQNYRCHFCGTNLSVKYIIEVFDPVIDTKPVKVCVCDKCVAFYGGNVNETLG